MLDPILVTGANSAVGRALLDVVESQQPVSETPAATPVDRRPPSIIACVRSERAAAQLGSRTAERIEIADYADATALSRAFRGARGVVHLPGVLIERAGSSYEQANVVPVLAALDAAKRADVRRFVLVSAIGADASASNRYYASKGRAEEAVRRSGLEHVVLRAPLLLGPGTEGEQALRRQLAGRAPWLLDGGRPLQQPLAVADLARAALACFVPERSPDVTLDLVGPETVSYRELLLRAAHVAGIELTPRASPLPVAFLRVLLRLRTRLLGAGFSSDALDVIVDSHDLDPGPAATALGLQLTSLDAMLRDMMEREKSA